MHCPICNNLLTETDGVFMCPSGHGTLMSGKLLGELKELHIPDEAPSAQAQDTAEKNVTCPHCSAPMQKVNYNNTGILIDSCTNCPYRWLAAGEIAKIEEYKPNIHPQDLLFLVGLQEKTKTLASNDTATGNPLDPEVPLYTGGLGGSIRGYMAGSDSRTLGWLTGAGMYGLIIGILKSKVVRIVAPIVVLGLIILGYLIFRQLNAVFSSRF